MNYYRRKRLQKGLDISDVANYLGIDYQKYESIDRGNVKMPKNLINKFNELMNKSKGEQMIKKLTREELVNNFWNDISIKENGKYRLYGIMAQYNIETLAELSYLLGYRSSAILSSCLTGTKEPNYDFKNKVYSFFENELNIQDPNKKIHRGQITVNDNEYLDWYKKFDIKKWLKDNKMNRATFSAYANISRSTLYYYVNNLVIPNTETIKKCKDAIERYEAEHSKDDEITTFEEVEQLEFPECPENTIPQHNVLVEKYINLVDELNGQAVEIIGDIQKLKEKLSDINNKKIIYEELIADLKGEK